MLHTFLFLEKNTDKKEGVKQRAMPFMCLV